jgi:hypothetical protein
MQIMNLKTIPSAKIVRWVRLFHFSLGFFLLLGTLLLNGCSTVPSAAVPLNWRKADTIPTALLQLAVEENTSLTSDRSRNVLVASIPTKDNNHLYIFNYNSTDICGKLGCLYVAYLEKGQSTYQQVLSLYLQPTLPPRQPLISASSESVTSPLPCLEVKQVERDILHNLTYCFNGSSYQLTRSDSALADAARLRSRARFANALNYPTHE